MPLPSSERRPVREHVSQTTHHMILAVSTYIVLHQTLSARALSCGDRKANQRTSEECLADDTHDGSQETIVVDHVRGYVLQLSILFHNNSLTIFRCFSLSDSN